MAAFAGIDKAVPAAGDSLGLGDDEIRALKLFLQEVFGIPDATTITEEAMNIGSNGSVVINDTGADIDFRVEGDNNANMIVVDAGQDAISFGGANVDGAAHAFNNLQQRTFITSVGAQIHIPAQTNDYDNASGTIAIGATHFFGIPTTTNANATLTITAHCNVYIEGIPVDSTQVTATTGYALFVDAGPSRIDGILFMDDNANSKMTAGITINQGAADNEILAFKSSDVDHPMTDSFETDTYATFSKASGASGGLQLIGLCDGANRGLLITGIQETEITTSTSASLAAIELGGSRNNSGALQAIGSTGNIVNMRTGTTTRWLIKGNGDVHQTTDAHTTLDEWDDVALCRAWDMDRAPEAVIKDEWDKFMTYKRKELIAAGIFNSYDKDALYNDSQLTRLHNGAIVQLGKKMMAMEQKFLALEAR